MNHSKRLKDIKGLSEAKIDKMLEASYKFVNVCGFRTATDVIQKVRASEWCMHARVIAEIE